jgi:hypothetical protein
MPQRRPSDLLVVDFVLLDAGRNWQLLHRLRLPGVRTPCP